jgi:hypothetical protein
VNKFRSVPMAQRPSGSGMPSPHTGGVRAGHGIENTARVDALGAANSEQSKQSGQTVQQMQADQNGCSR